MPVTLESLPNELNFMIEGPLAQHIWDWADAMDKLVFEKQVAINTEKYRVPDLIRRVQEQAKAAGKIFPWYSGFTGSWGGLSYMLQVVNSMCQVSVRNLIAGETATFSDEQVTDQVGNSTSENVQAKLRLVIEGAQLKYLRHWKYWVEAEALTSRYVYEFVETEFLGAAIYAVQINDLQSGNKINLFDYDDEFDNALDSVS